MVETDISLPTEHIIRKAMIGRSLSDPSNGRSDSGVVVDVESPLVARTDPTEIAVEGPRGSSLRIPDCPDIIRQRRRPRKDTFPFRIIDTYIDTGEKDLDLHDREARARGLSERRTAVLAAWNVFAGLIVFWKYLITIECAFTVSMSIGMTLWIYFLKSDKEAWNGSNMDWVLLGFAVVTPTTMSIGFAFRRREIALRSLTELKSTMLHIYIALSSWDWDKGAGRAANGNAALWMKQSDRVLGCLISLGDELYRYLSLPTSSRSRHRVTAPGRREALRTVTVAYDLFDSIAVERIIEISSCTEHLKTLGFPSSEVSRVRQYERYLSVYLEDLRIKKSYRTPQALRSFSRVFSIFLPLFYTPAYARLAFDTHLAIGIIFAILAPLSLTALYESICFLEDPFISSLTLDGIDVREELVVLSWYHLLRARAIIFPDAPDATDLFLNHSPTGRQPVDTIELFNFRRSSYVQGDDYGDSEEDEQSKATAGRKSRFDKQFSRNRL